MDQDICNLILECEDRKKKRKLETEMCIKERKRQRNLNSASTSKDTLQQQQQQQQPQQEEEWITLESVFRRRIETAIVVNIKYIDPREFLNGIKHLVCRNIEQRLMRLKTLKLHLTLCCEFISPTTEDDKRLLYFTTPSKLIVASTNIVEMFEHLITIILNKMSEFNERGSGLALSNILHLLIGLVKCDIFYGGCRKDVVLPVDLLRKNAVVNVNTLDLRCFLWSIVAHMFPVQTGLSSSNVKNYPQNLYEIFNIKGIEFPISINAIRKFENQNPNISVNVFEYDNKIKKVTCPLYITKEEKVHHANLLFLRNNNIGHFCLIKNLSALVRRQITSHTEKIYFCNMCLSRYRTIEKLEIHKIDCKTQKPVEICYPEKDYLNFSAYRKTLKLPFIVYADFECLLQHCQPNKKNLQTEHIPYSVAYNIICSYDTSQNKFNSYRGKNPVEWFLSKLQSEIPRLECEMETNLKIDMNIDQMKEYTSATSCGMCQSKFSSNNPKLRHHDHITGKYISTLCNACNLKIRKEYIVPVVFHNLSKYDGHLILSACNLGTNSLSVLAKDKENYISFSMRIGNCEVRFIDSYRFLSASLQDLVGGLEDEDFVCIKKEFPQDIDNRLLRQKGVFPYSYVNSFIRLNDRTLPEQSKFFNDITNCELSDSDYQHAQKVWQHFECKTLGDYSDLYLQTDVLLLSDVFERFRRICLKSYELDPASFVSLPGFSWQAALKLSRVSMQFLKDPDMILFFERGIRGGITTSIHRYAEANNEFCANYNASIPKSYLLYIDANNLYAWAMSKKLPIDSFAWLNETELEVLFNQLQCTDDDDDDDANKIQFGQAFDKSCVLEVDLEYPLSLHDAHEQFPFCAQHVNDKLLTTLENKERYIIYFDNLVQCMRQGLKLIKIHRAISFKHEAWLEKFVAFNTAQRTVAKTKFEQDSFKLINNSVYGKCLENIREHTRIVLCNTWEKARKLISKINYKDYRIFHNDLVAIELRKTQICYDKPIYVGQVILEISKILMYDFHYKFAVPEFSKNFKVQLCYMDTDSFVYHLVNNSMNQPQKSIYSVIKEHAEAHFDTSSYGQPNIFDISDCNRKVLGKFKDEVCGNIMTHFVSLRPKMYSFRLANGEEIKKVKGVAKSCSKDLIFDNFCDVLFDRECCNENAKVCKFNTIQSNGHQIFTRQVRKICLTKYDDKRVISADKINTLPYGHYSFR